jgi:hypothetical protein
VGVALFVVMLAVASAGVRFRAVGSPGSARE